MADLFLLVACIAGICILLWAMRGRPICPVCTARPADEGWYVLGRAYILGPFETEHKAQSYADAAEPRDSGLRCFVFHGRLVKEPE